MNFYFQLIIKSWKNYENLDFSTSGLCLAFKKIFGLFSIFLAFRYLEYSKSFKFELFWSNFVNKTIFAENLAKWISVNCEEEFRSRVAVTVSKSGQNIYPWLIEEVIWDSWEVLSCFKLAFILYKTWKNQGIAYGINRVNWLLRKRK